MREIIKLLEKDCRLTTEEIAKILKRDTAEVEKQIKEMEESGIIAKYKAIINWEKVDENLMYALIEVKITPQTDMGFERVAKRIYQFPEVHSMYLMSGGYDLAINIKGRTIHDIAKFVTEKLSVLDCVISTSTHFVLKKYKDSGVVFSDGVTDNREVISFEL